MRIAFVHAAVLLSQRGIRNNASLYNQPFLVKKKARFPGRKQQENHEMLQVLSFEIKTVEIVTKV